MDRLKPTVIWPPPSDEPSLPTYVLGLDLGQSQDYSALTIDEVHDRGLPESRHLVRHLHRWRLGTPYPKIVDDVAGLIRRPPISPAAFLVIDATGVGPPVVDMFKAAHLPIQIVPILITAGHEATEQEDKGWHVPKRDLVSTVTVLLQSSRLRIAPELPEAPLLTGELETFQTKITAAANDVYGTWREGVHDDMVLATALAAWYGENTPPPTGGAFVMGSVVRGSARSEGGARSYISRNGGAWEPARTTRVIR